MDLVVGYDQHFFQRMLSGQCLIEEITIYGLGKKCNFCRTD
jgi:hypothetical protein